MKTILKSNSLVLVPELKDEGAALQSWKTRHDDQVFAHANTGAGARFVSLGARATACREPINVHSKSRDPQIRLIANFAATPFDLDDVRYASVEAFWQSLRFPPEQRAAIVMLDGAAAKRASAEQPYGSHVIYAGREIPVGAFDHWQLMRGACRAKFDQNEDARAALLATGDRPLIHVVKPDSRTIPGVIMADIWMALRARLRAKRKGKSK